MSIGSSGIRLDSGGPALQRLLLDDPRVHLASQLLHIVAVVLLLSPMMRISELVLLPFLLSFLFLVLDAKGGEN